LKFLLDFHQALNLSNLQIGHELVRHVHVKAPEDLNVGYVIDHLTHLSLVVHGSNYGFRLCIHQLGPLDSKRHLSADFNKYLLLLSIFGSLFNDHGFEALYLLLRDADKEVLQEDVVADAVCKHTLLHFVKLLQKLWYVLDYFEETLISE
jgi:hypothetical protein